MWTPAFDPQDTTFPHLDDQAGNNYFGKEAEKCMQANTSFNLIFFSEKNKTKKKTNNFCVCVLILPVYC